MTWTPVADGTYLSSHELAMMAAVDVGWEPRTLVARYDCQVTLQRIRDLDVAVVQRGTISKTVETWYRDHVVPDLADDDEPTLRNLVPDDVARYWDSDPTDVHTWFGLSYANYAVLNRTALQSMPLDWQVRFVRCMRELEHVLSAAGIEAASTFDVQAVEVSEEWQDPDPDDPDYDEDDAGEMVRVRRPVEDPIPHYNRGRTRLDLTPKDRADA